MHRRWCAPMGIVFLVIVFLTVLARVLVPREEGVSVPSFRAAIDYLSNTPLGVVTNRGTVTFRKPFQWRWEYMTKDETNVSVCNGASVWCWSQDGIGRIYDVERVDVHRVECEVGWRRGRNEIMVAKGGGLLGMVNLRRDGWYDY